MQSQETLVQPRLDSLYSAGMNIGEWVRAARDSVGWSQEQLGAVVEKTKGNVSAWENGRHEPSYEQLSRIAKATGYPLSRLGADASDPPTPSMTPILSWQYEDDLPPGDFVMVPRLDVRLSAGHGREQIELSFQKGQPQAFRADWIRTMHLKPNRLAAMSAEGDSMEPRIRHGDSLLVDTSQVDVIDGRTYALWYEGGERVKRLFRLPGGGLRIMSDNDNYAPIDVLPEHTEHVRVIGRVVAVAGTGGL
jgi:phage repressor protein C with HTH and peptisase S24 domain